MQIETIATNKVKFAPYNPRKVEPEVLDRLRRSIEEFGYIEPMIVNRRNMHVVGGNQRLKVLRELKVDEAQVVFVDLDDAREKALNVALNKIHGEWDLPLLKDLFEEIDTGEIDLELTGFGLDEIEDLMTQFNVDGDEVDAEPQIDRAEELREQWGVELGQLWQCGDHRVICGDCRDRDVVGRVIGGEKADMVLTDPPYGVAYTGGTKDALTIENDALDEKSLKNLVMAAFDMCEEHSRKGAYWYATVPAGPLHLVFAEDWKGRGILRQILVWAKDTMVLGHSEYHYQHEPILFGWREGKRHKNADRTRTSLWEHKRPKASREHPTMKPLSLWSQAVRDGSVPGETVLDPFLGSGTTLIACENLNRKCRGIEISPAYVAVTLQRYQDATGKEPVRIEG